MRAIKNFVMKHSNKIAAFSFLFATGFLGPCRFIVHQPEIPEELRR